MILRRNNKAASQTETADLASALSAAASGPSSATVHATHGSSAALLPKTERWLWALIRQSISKSSLWFSSSAISRQVCVSSYYCSGYIVPSTVSQAPSSPVWWAFPLSTALQFREPTRAALPHLSHKFTISAATIRCRARAHPPPVEPHSTSVSRTLCQRSI